MAKYTYFIESVIGNDWVTILRAPLHRLRDIINVRKQYQIRTSYRLVRSDGKILDEVASTIH